MRYLSLFSGIEAATAAWHPLGWEPVAFAEIEPFPSSVLAHHYPGVPNLGDVTKIDESTIALLGPIDLVVFGSPCQDLSVAGKRKGLAGERSGLFHDAVRIIEWAREHCGCRWALWENVPGAFSSNKGADFAVVVGELAGVPIDVPPKGWGTEGCALGEKGMVEWGTLDAQWFGVAQRRRRVFALADFGDWAGRPPILLEPEGMRGDSAPRRETGQGVAPTIRAGAPNGGAGHGARSGDSKDELIVPVLHGLSVAHAPEVAACLETTANDYSRADGFNMIAHALRADGFDASEDGTGRGTPLVAFRHNAQACSQGAAVVFAFDSLSSNSMKSSNPRSGCREVDVAKCLDTTIPDPSKNQGGNAVLQAAHSHAVAFSFDTTQITSPENSSRVDPSLPCHTLNSNAHVPAVAYGAQDDTTPKVTRERAGCLRRDAGGEGSCVLTPAMQVRRLTPRECERLQAFKDDFTLTPHRGKPAADGPRYKALGNSMCVSVMRWIGEQIENVRLFQ